MLVPANHGGDDGTRPLLSLRSERIWSAVVANSWQRFVSMAGAVPTHHIHTKAYDGN